jgi:hypothetical protein
VKKHKKRKEMARVEHARCWVDAGVRNLALGGKRRREGVGRGHLRNEAARMKLVQKRAFKVVCPPGGE